MKYSPVPCAALLLMPLAALLAAETTPQAAITNHVQEIIVVCKMHFDIGYTHRVKDLLNYYRTTMIDRALDIMDQSKNLPCEQQFVWTAPGWVMNKVLEDWPGQTPERRQRLDAAIKSGQFVTHAMPFTIEAELMEPEDFARQYLRIRNSMSPDIRKIRFLGSAQGARLEFRRSCDKLSLKALEIRPHQPDRGLQT